MAVIQAITLCAIFIYSNAYFLPPNDGTEFRDHFLKQKLNFLEDKLKDTPADFNLIKQNIEARKLDTNEDNDFDKTWLLQNIGPKFDFIKQKIESKQGEDSTDLNDFNQKVAFLETFLNQHLKESTHGISKRSIKEENPPNGAAIGDYYFNKKMGFLGNKFKDGLVDFDAIKTKIDTKRQDKHKLSKRSVKETASDGAVDGAAIGSFFLNKKLAFLENKFKDTLVDFDAIKAKIDAKKNEVNEEPVNVIKDEKLTTVLNFLKQLHDVKLNEKHTIAKRSTKETSDGAAIGTFFLNQKLAFLGDKFKGTPIDFEAIKAKIEAKKALEQEEAIKEQEEANDVVVTEKNLPEKLVFLQNFLKELKADKLKLIIDKLETSQ